MNLSGVPAGPVRLRADGRETTPRFGSRLVATVDIRPRLSWVVPPSWTGRRQCAFEVRIARGGSDPRHADARLFAHAASESGGNSFVVAVDLAPHEAYSWTVRVRDETQTWSEWAEPASLETGPLSFDDWTARWVSHPALATLRRQFDLRVEPRRARLHLAAQGLVRATVNGVPVNADATDSTRVDYVRSLYRTYDVTDLCSDGANTLDLTLARGEWARTELDPRVLGELVIDTGGRGRVTVGTGPGLLAAPSEVVVEDPFYLERHDPTALTGDFASSPQSRVLAAADPPRSPHEPPCDVGPDPTPALRNVLTMTPAEIGRVGTARVFDVGANVAGRSELELVSLLPPGHEIRIVHGEHLDSAGRLDTTNLTMPFDHGRVRQATEYVTTGHAGQRCVPWFAYHGFRYVELQGLPEDAEVRLRVHTHHTDLVPISRLVTDDGQINRLVERASRTLLNNVHGIPEDCPTREQSGWTGDTASVAEFEFAAFDVEAFLRKWLADMRTSQQADGAIPAIVPDLRSERVPADPVWGAALQRVLVNHWYHYGDRRVVEENLPALRRWADFLLSARDSAGIVSGAPISYGSDWLALQQTPPPVHHTAAAIDCLNVLAELEDAVGEPALARARIAQADQLRAAARLAFFDASTGTFGNGSQGSYACAIEAGILIGDEAEDAVERIEHDIRARGNRVSSGFATTRSVVRALARFGRSQTVFDVVQQREEPGVGAMVDHGPGTFWECWWIDQGNTGTGSLDHVGLGGPFASWAWQNLAGITPLAGGYARFAVAPHFVAGVDFLSIDTETVHGLIHLDYRRSTDRMQVSVTVPIGTRAVVELPGSASHTVGPGVHRYEFAVPVMHSSPGLPTSPWRPPPIAPIAGDAGAGADLLQAAIAEGRCRVERGRFDVLAEGLSCMPVPHAQEPGPVLRVINEDPHRDISLVRLGFGEPLTLGDAAFVYAMIDVCAMELPGPIETVISLWASDGTRADAVGRFWPAGWNRVAIDIGTWPGRFAVTAIDAGIRYTDSGDDATARAGPVTFHLGGIGYSTLARTW